MAVVARRSAGVLLWRRGGTNSVEVLIGHMGGPFWARRDAGAWSIPKGEFDADVETPFETALREFTEELGQPPPSDRPDDYVDLGEFRQSNKTVRVYAIEGDVDPSVCVSNTFEMEWPRGSGSIGVFPEVDRVEWSDLPAARSRLVKGQVAALDALASHLD